MRVATKYQFIPETFKYSALSIFFVLLSGFVISQKEWTLNLEKEDIRIYSKTIPGSKIRALRVTCIVEATLTQVAAGILDIKTQDEWLYNTRSQLLQEVSPLELYYYTEINFPFPFNNRDYIGHVKLAQDTNSSIISVDVQNVPDFIEEKKSIIRIRQSASHWVLTKAENNSVSIDFTLFVDPAGYIPSWLVNLFSTKGPFESFKKLKIHLRNSRYLNVSLPFVKN